MPLPPFPRATVDGLPMLTRGGGSTPPRTSYSPYDLLRLANCTPGEILVDLPHYRPRNVKPYPCYSHMPRQVCQWASCSFLPHLLPLVSTEPWPAWQLLTLTSPTRLHHQPESGN